MIATAERATKPRRPKPVPPGATHLTPPQLAERWQKAPEAILELIRTGQLRAIDMAKPGSKRPRFRISIPDIEAFEARRAVVAPASKPAKRSRPDPRVTHYV